MTVVTTSPRLLPANPENDRFWWDEISLSVGEAKVDVLLISDGHALTGLWFGPTRPGTPDSPGSVRDRKPVADAAAQLAAYAEGELTEFDVPLRPSGSEFQRSVWELLLDIPYGVTTTYGKVASDLGKPKASRAVGAAVGSNPLSIIVPCHRVIGADGSLTGYGGGLENKVALLKLEGVSAL
ncbi:MAG TPA: methylated-DNA--[protein]-cysteine S-methyltransferase [Acidimicrobiales bacterium]|nr:methylated-DNA--[protein]-cysteine S-methyltransferase [Acidimicrobiales bacterium]